MKLNLNKPLAIFDLETTGTNIISDRIIEIYILKIMPDGTEKTKHDLLNPTIPISPQASKVNNIWDKDVKDKPTFKEVSQSYYQFLENCDLVGFNSNKFDIPLLITEFERAGLQFDTKHRKCVDVQNIFHKMEPRNLSAAYKFYCNQELINAHSAEADVVATYKILLGQIEKYENVEYIDKNGEKSCPVVNDISALSKFSNYNRSVDINGQIILDDNNDEIFNFGKYKGRKVEEVLLKEHNYYDWLMKADFPLSTKNIFTAIKIRSAKK